MDALLFDIDGTLINTGGAGGAALREAFCEEFVIDEPAQVPFAGRTDRGIGSDLFRAHEIDDSDDNWQKLRAGYLARLQKHLDERDGQVLAGVVELLYRLHRRTHAVLGLLTGNTAHGARIKLSHFGIFDYFRFGGFGDSHPHRNDVARLALDEATRHVNGDGLDRVWVIGDTPLDIACARAIDAQVLAVATGVHGADELAAAEPDVLLDDLSDTERVVDLLS